MALCEWQACNYCRTSSSVDKQTGYRLQWEESQWHELQTDRAIFMFGKAYLGFALDSVKKESFRCHYHGDYF